MKLNTEKLIQNGKAIARLSYDVNINQWIQDTPALFFHVEGNPECPVSGYVNIDETLANDMCNAFNQKHFGESIRIVSERSTHFVCGQTTITDTYMATVQSHEVES